MRAIPLHKRRAAALVLVSCVACGAAQAQVVSLPGAADAARVRPEKNIPAIRPENLSPALRAPEVAPAKAPKGAEKYRFVLKTLEVSGASALDQQSLRALYADKIGAEITLDVLYDIANRITQQYRDQGYFLSRAYVPAQEIWGGKAVIQVVEGYVAQVDVPKGYETEILRQYVARLTSEKPLKITALESFLLRINDLPGYAVSGTLSAISGHEEGAVRLTLHAADKAASGQISFDNAASRFLGPNTLSASYSASLLPLQRTTVSAQAGLPTQKMRVASLRHEVAVAPDIMADMTTSITEAKPGYSLSRFDIESRATYWGVGLAYQPIRQRHENATLRVTVDGRNSNSDTLGTALTRDRIRALRLNAAYDLADGWSGVTAGSVTISKGIGGLGASSRGATNLSRAEARPDFTKVEFSLNRLQALGPSWSMLLSASGQYASAPLFSAEEFGYGGQVFGRAFDASELTGDQGISGAVELRYAGFDRWYEISFQPYAFYDVGMVWNMDSAQLPRETGTSAGLGVRMAAPYGLSGNAGLAFPLTRDVATPIYGQQPDQPRIILQFSKAF